MAKFRNGQNPNETPIELDSVLMVDGSDIRDRNIGAILAEVRNLDVDQVQAIVDHQAAHGLRFGESAIALGFVNKDDVLFALAQQFHYPYVHEAKADLSNELVALHHPFSPQAEAFRAIRSQLMVRVFSESDSPRRALAIVSPDSGDGKTFFVANLAVCLAQLGGRTLAVDADLRGPRLHEIFNVSNTTGLSGILSGRREAAVQNVASIPGLFVLPGGVTPPNPLELLERPAFGLLIRELASKFDYVIVDSPAGFYGVDYAVIAARCGASMVIARKDAGHLAALQTVVASISDSRSKAVGVVMNDH